MNAHITGASLIAAAALFWLSWLLMPGVGVTDASRIFELVATQRLFVMLSVITQLLSAAFYVPALLGIASTRELADSSAVRWSACLLLLGAMGSAADAILHLMAYAMTAPGLESESLLHVMAFMQGPGLVLLAPLIVSFFVGGACLSAALARLGKVSSGNVHAHVAAVGFALLGGAGVSAGIVSSRAVGLMTLGAVAVAQAWIGVELCRPHAGLGRSRMFS